MRRIGSRTAVVTQSRSKRFIDHPTPTCPTKESNTRFRITVHFEEQGPLRSSTELASMQTEAPTQSTFAVIYNSLTHHSN